MKSIASFLCLGAWILSGCGSGHETSSTRIETREGPVEGVIEAGLMAFKGIPYAQAPVGALRWQAPQKPLRRQQVLSANTYASACIQTTSSAAGTTTPATEGPAELAGAFPPPASASEDCLYLNVFKPAAASAGARLPVLVYVHGGAFTQGSGEGDFSALVQQGVLVVSINYRLGALGYLVDSEIAKGDRQAAFGNFGLRDQIAAIDWVHDNIAAFGGDPQRMSYWGTSAGATSGFSVLQSPLSKGLLAAAVLQSGGGGSYSNPSIEQSAKAGSALVKKLQCDSAPDRAACLRAVPAADILAAQDNVRWRPTVDGVVLTHAPAQAFESGNFNHVPVILGGVRDEGTLFSTPALPASYYASAVSSLISLSGASAETALHDYPLSAFSSPGMAFARVQGDALYACGNAARGDALSRWVPVYSYEFTDPAKSFPAEPAAYYYGTFHGYDSLYWFGTRNAATVDAQRLSLQNAMLEYLLQFIRTGNPNRQEGTQVPWPRYSQSSPTVQALTIPQIAPRTDFKAVHRCDSTWAAPQLPAGFF